MVNSSASQFFFFDEKKNWRYRQIQGKSLELSGPKQMAFFFFLDLKKKGKKNLVAGGKTSGYG